MYRSTLTEVSGGIARWATALGLVCLCSAPSHAATLLFLEDGNSRVDFCISGCDDDLVETGANQWIVDDVNYLFQEWFWYRVDPDPPTGPGDGLRLDQIGNPTYSGGAGGNSATVAFENDAIKATIDYTLFGGLPGSNQSVLQEIVTLTNKNSTASVWLNLFQYSDFDMCGVGSNDSASIETDGFHYVSTQTGDCAQIMAQTFVDAVNHFDADEAGAIPARIEADLDLSDNPSVGGVDASSAFQWTTYTDSLNFATETGSGSNVKMFGITKVIAPAVPEPMSILLLGTGLLGIGRTARRRMKARA